jgi:hypothetical protein
MTAKYWNADSDLDWRDAVDPEEQNVRLDEILDGQEVRSFAPEVIADSSLKWAGNAVRFATETEAQMYALDLACRWTAVRETRVVPSHEPVTYAWEDGKLVPVKPGDVG